MPHYQFLSGDYAGQAYKRYQQAYPDTIVSGYGGYSQPSKPCTCLEDVKGSALAAEVMGRNSYVRQAASWFGWGDYNISTNSLIQGGSGMNSSARLQSTGAREVRLVYREYIGDVFTHPTIAGAFYQQNFAINPGLIDVAPWLSSLSNNYEQWRPNGILFEFVSTSGDITTNQALGKIIMATDYRADTLETKFSNVQEMLAEAYAQEAKPTSNMIHGLECAPSERTRNLYYTRAGGIPSGTSLSDYDLAQTTVATVGGPDVNTNLGSLYIHWDISLFKPILYEGVQNKGAIYRSYGGTPDLEHWLGNPVYIQNGTGQAGGSFTPSPDNIVPVLNAYERTADFTLVDLGDAQELVFPRWATVGSKWLVYLSYTGTITSVGGLNKAVPSFDQTNQQWSIVSQGLFPTSIETPANATDLPVSCTTYLILEVKGNSPEIPCTLTLNFPSVSFFDGWVTKGTKFTIISVPNFTTG